MRLQYDANCWMYRNVHTANSQMIALKGPLPSCSSMMGSSCCHKDSWQFFNQRIYNQSISNCVYRLFTTSVYNCWKIRLVGCSHNAYKKFLSSERAWLAQVKRDDLKILGVEVQKNTILNSTLVPRQVAMILCFCMNIYRNSVLHYSWKGGTTDHIFLGANRSCSALPLLILSDLILNLDFFSFSSLALKSSARERKNVPLVKLKWCPTPSSF